MIRAWLLTMCALALWSCTETAPRTEIMVEIDADDEIRSRLHTLRVLVYGSDDQGQHWQESINKAFTVDDIRGPWSSFDWPARVALVPKSGRTDRHLDVQAQASDAEGEILVWQSAAASFAKGRTTALRLELIAACRADVLACGDPACVGSGAQCDTCRDGQCVEVGFIATLPDYAPGLRDAGEDAAVADGGDDSGGPSAPDASQDAGKIDAGDAAQPDAAGGDASDAAQLDAAGSDAGASDANGMEASVMDASGSDAGDAGSADTGAVDANQEASTPPVFEATSMPGQISTVKGPIGVDFSAPLQSGSVTLSSFLVQRDGQPVAGTLMVSASTVNFTPTLPWALGATYTIDLGADLRDTSDRALTPATLMFSVREGQWVAPSSLGAGSGAPALAMSADGQASLVWPLSSGSYPQMWASRYSPDSPSWTSSVQISTGTAQAPANSPFVVMNAAGHAVAVWQYYDGVQSSGFVDGTSWSAPQRTLDGSAYAPAVMFAASGDRAFAAMQFNHATLSTGVVDFNAGTSSGATITDVGGSVMGATDSAPQIALLNVGPIVVWKRVASSQTRIYAAPVSLNAASPLSAMNAPAGDPALAADPKHNSALAIWTQADVTWTNVWAARITSGGAWSAATRVSNDASSTIAPKIGVDGKGRAIAVWTQSGAIMSARFVPGQAWSASAAISAAGVTTASVPSVAVEPGGNAVAAWTQDGASAKEVWIARYVFDGGGWMTTQRKRVSDPDAGVSGAAAVALDASGRGFVTWYQGGAIWFARFQ